jgi:hypothetical protein
MTEGRERQTKAKDSQSSDRGKEEPSAFVIKVFGAVVVDERVDQWTDDVSNESGPVTSSWGFALVVVDGRGGC